MSAAHWAFIRNPPSSTNSTTSGMTAKIVDRPSELPTGLRSCVYTCTPPLARSRSPEASMSALPRVHSDGRVRALLDHLVIRVVDVERSVRFYERALAPL